MAELYLGLMSGTSADGIDAVLAEFDGATFIGLRESLHLDYEPQFRSRLLGISLDQPKLGFRDVAELDVGVARHFAEAANRLLTKASLAPAAVRAIGSHGQTVFHDGPSGLTTQLGDPNLIAARTGIATIADFRRRDLALGGQGAPLVPAFHHALFGSSSEQRCVLNIGGIANVTLLPSLDAAEVRGFDTGPGNGLLDEWISETKGETFDRNGEFAASGRINAEMVAALLSDSYFRLPAPKSTGRDYFRLSWVRKRFPALAALSAEDVQASLCEVTARSVADAIKTNLDQPARVLVCGGGSRNGFLMQRLSACLGGMPVMPTDAYGLQAEWIEAAAFAWLAMRFVHGLPGNLPAVTGASRAVVLGGLYPA